MNTQNKALPPMQRFKVLQEYKKDLPHKLSPEEFRAKSKELADLARQKREHEMHVEQTKADLKKREKFLDGEWERLSSVVDTEQETRSVMCVERIDFDRNVRETVRLDFPEGDRRGVVDSVPLTESERRHQLEMFEKETLKKQREDDEAAQKAAAEESARGEKEVKVKPRPPYPGEGNGSH